MQRISRKQLMMEKALLISRRSTCTRKKVGCVAVIDNREVASGYNGVLPGYKPETGLDEDGNSNTVHAEANMIAFCARKGIAIEGAIIYITLSPCEKCAELLIQARVSKVIYLDEYRCTKGIEKLESSGIPTVKYDSPW